MATNTLIVSVCGLGDTHSCVWWVGEEGDNMEEDLPGGLR